MGRPLWPPGRSYRSARSRAFHLLKRSRHPEADFVDAEVRRHGVAKGRAEVVSFVIPGAAARNVGGAALKEVSGTVGGRFFAIDFVTDVIAVLDPLPYIAVHVVEA